MYSVLDSNPLFIFNRMILIINTENIVIRMMKLET